MTDPELRLIQFLLIRRGILPGEYYALPEGEKVLIRVLFDDYARGSD